MSLSLRATRLLLPAIAFSLLACSPQADSPSSATAPDGHNAANSLDWAGYYFGTLPCASCPGIETWLELNDFDDKVQYQLVENYLEETDASFRSAGEAQWNASGNQLALKGADENRVLAVAEDHVIFLGEGQDIANADPAYRLAKLEAYAGNGQQLLLDPAAIETETRSAGGPVLNFDAVINFEHPVDGSVGPGHQSLRAYYVLDCAKKTIAMPNVRYYSEHFATGKLLDEAENPAGEADVLEAGDDPLWQVAQRHCGEE